MKIQLNKKKHNINAIFKGCIYGYDKPGNSAMSLASIDVDPFLIAVKNEFPETVFDNTLDNQAKIIDTLRLYDAVKYPGDPDIEIILTLYQNTSTSYSLSIK